MANGPAKKRRLEPADAIASSIGAFISLSGHEESAKYGIRLMSADQLDGLRDACDRMKEWIKEIQVERLGLSR